jgi:hypothetical protein
MFSSVAGLDSKAKVRAEAREGRINSKSRRWQSRIGPFWLVDLAFRQADECFDAPRERNRSIRYQRRWATGRATNNDKIVKGLF